MASQILYIGSHTGDSQLVRLLQAPTFSSDTDTLPIPPTISTSLPSVLDSERESEEREKGVVVKLKGSYVEHLEPFRNIAPIVDATIADLDGSGQVTI